MASLTAAQRNALLILRQYADSFGPSPFTKPWRTQAATLYRLADLGYVETQERPMTTVARITAAGRAVLDG